MMTLRETIARELATRSGNWPVDPAALTPSDFYGAADAMMRALRDYSEQLAKLAKEPPRETMEVPIKRFHIFSGNDAGPIVKDDESRVVGGGGYSGGYVRMPKTQTGKVSVSVAGVGEPPAPPLAARREKVGEFEVDVPNTPQDKIIVRHGPGHLLYLSKEQRDDLLSALANARAIELVEEARSQPIKGQPIKEAGGSWHV